MSNSAARSAEAVKPPDSSGGVLELTGQFQSF